MTALKKSGVFVLSFIIGGALGGAIALLYAPESGKRLRKNLGRKTSELIESSRKKTQDTWNDAKERAESSLDSANEYLNTGLDKISRNAEKVKNSLKTGFRAGSDVNNSAEDVENIHTQNK